MKNKQDKEARNGGSLLPDKKAPNPAVQANGVVDEAALFERVSAIIENRKSRAAAYANSEVTLMFWEVGQYINSAVLDFKRARMMQFAEQFSDFGIVSPLATQLSWSHFTELLPLKSDEARLYYAKYAADSGLATKELRRQISRKAFERREIANSQLTKQSSVPFNVFKDPYLLDLFGLKDNYLEADLEQAILTGIEAFILEFGHGFTFAERQKRMIIGGEDVVLDLLFYNRVLRRLVAVELKLGVFKAAYKGQMELYLNWLDQYERQPGEEPPIGIILCASANREKVEMLKMDRAGIAVAEYWTHLPPKAEFERKIREILTEAQERLERRKLLTDGDVQRQIDYFIEQKDDEDE